VKKSKFKLEFTQEKCISCAGCVGTCPDLALDMYLLELQVFEDKCTNCGICARACPVGALQMIPAEVQSV
jgi:ferredoxin